MGIGEITKGENITKDSIGEVGTIDKTVGIQGKSKVVVFDDDLVAGPSQLASRNVSGISGASGASGSNGSNSNTANTIGTDPSCGTPESKTVCRRATTLHTETCDEYFDDWGCRQAGYARGATITYGTIWDGTSELKAGDALDCDVNGDGTFDAETERFYYFTHDNCRAILLYYSNVVNNGKPSGLDGLTYDSDMDENGYMLYVHGNGPRTAVGTIATTNTRYSAPLPTTSKWSNVNLRNSVRKIGNVNFSYEGFAARILSYEEATSVCDKNDLFGSCQFALEHTRFANNEYYETCGEFHEPYRCDEGEPTRVKATVSGYILEGEITEHGEHGDYTDGTCIWIIESYEGIGTVYTSPYGVRPAIEVPFNQISAQ